MVRWWMCGVVVVAMIFSSLGWSAPAMAKQPSDYYVTEFLSGSAVNLIGGLSFGVVGLLFGLADPFDQCGGRTPCFASLGLAANFFVGSLIFVSPIAAMGVVNAGQANDVVGNIVAAYIGSSLGSLIVFNSHLSDSLSYATAMLVIPSALAVIGFNIGAKMKDTGQPASLPWTLDLPVLSLEF